MVPTRLGSYEIVGRLGVGGMGEVYRAHDPALRRDVAIKVLPAEVARDPERLARLQREAQLLATLQDPHLASVYGFEQHDDSAFLVMELVEGQGLDELVAGGPLPLGEALDLAAQVAAGLAAAHDRGIIHRDLKPSNVRVTPEGTAKVLDFGLAKADPESPSGVSSPDITASPTMAAVTMAGAILGTAAYMSPEQARGKGLDRRTDVWSFGCLLYELLTGDRPFSGETITDVLAAIVKDEPNWQALPTALDGRILELLRRCLRKDARQRHRDLGDASLQIREVMAGASDVPDLAGLPAESADARSGGRALAVAGWAVAGVMALVALTVWMWGGDSGRGVGSAMTWLTLPEPASAVGNSASNHERPVLAISPAGDAIVYADGRAEGGEASLRRFDAGEYVRLEATAGAQSAAFSPDGASIAVGAGDRLLTVPSAGGVPVEVCVPCEAVFGITWTESDVLVVSSGWGTGLTMVPATGGELEALTVLEPERGDVSHLYPRALPGGDRVLFSIWAVDIEDRLAAVVSLVDRSVKIVARGGNGYRQAGEHLFFERSGVLYAQRFNARTVETEGEAFAIADDLARTSADGYVAYDVSRSSGLVYQLGVDGSPNRAVWVDRQGNRSMALPEQGLFTNPALSYDDQILALAAPVENSGYRLHVYDLEGGTRTEITSVGDNLAPVFAADGKDVFYISSRSGGYVVARSPVDGSSNSAVRIVTGEYGAPSSVSPDGRSLLYDLQAAGNSDVWLHTEGDAAPRPLASTSAFESGGTFSADGDWVAYTSDASGRRELYVTPAAGAVSARQVTQMGIRAAQWSPAGDEIFLQKGSGIWSLPVQTDPALRVGEPQKLFDVPGMRGPDSARAEFAVSADGQRFLVLQFAEREARFQKIEVIQNLPELLRRRAEGLR